jgi:hypothetical protein
LRFTNTEIERTDRNQTADISAILIVKQPVLLTGSPVKANWTPFRWSGRS